MKYINLITTSRTDKKKLKNQLPQIPCTHKPDTVLSPSINHFFTQRKQGPYTSSALQWKKTWLVLALLHYYFSLSQSHPRVPRRTTSISILSLPPYKLFSAPTRPQSRKWTGPRPSCLTRNG